MGIEEFLLNQAKNEGLEQGIEKGIEKGIEQGIEQGIVKGMNLKDFEFTKNLLSSTDFSTAKIAELVGVSEDFVLKVKKNLNL